MMRILFYLLPVLPAIFYILYYLIRHRKRTRDEILVGLKDGKWLAVFITCLVFTIALVIGAALQNSDYQGDKYTPAKFENGVLTPSRIEK